MRNIAAWRMLTSMISTCKQPFGPTHGAVCKLNVLAETKAKVDISQLLVLAIGKGHGYDTRSPRTNQDGEEPVVAKYRRTYVAPEARTMCTVGTAAGPSSI